MAPTQPAQRVLPAPRCDLLGHCERRDLSCKRRWGSGVRVIRRVAVLLGARKLWFGRPASHPAARHHAAYASLLALTIALRRATICCMPQMRSPNYPAVSLPDAVDLLAKLYQREKRSPVDPERAALAWGYSSLSGPPRSKLSALRKYGLVEDTTQGIRISDRGLTILSPLSEEEKQAALRDAAVEPALFRELASFPGASDENLMARLVRIGFTEAGAKLAVASYRETMSLAGPEATAYSHPHAESPGGPDLVLAQAPRPTASGSSTLGVTLKGGVRVELRVLDGEMTPDAVNTMRSFFEWSAGLRPAPEAETDGAASPAPERVPNEPLLLGAQSPTDAQD